MVGFASVSLALRSLNGSVGLAGVGGFKTHVNADAKVRTTKGSIKYFVDCLEATPECCQQLCSSPPTQAIFRSSAVHSVEAFGAAFPAQTLTSDCNNHEKYGSDRG